MYSDLEIPSAPPSSQNQTHYGSFNMSGTGNTKKQMNQRLAGIMGTYGHPGGIQTYS
jgi:hypothetical protein